MSTRCLGHLDREHGQTIPEIMDDYDLTENQIRAAIKYAKRGIEEKFPGIEDFDYFLIQLP